MSATLAATALLMGLAGSPHCAAMCGAVCATLVGPGRRRRESVAPASGAAEAVGASAGVVWMTPAPAAETVVARTGALLAGRLVSYAALGAVVAASVSALASIGATAAPLRPMWAMLHVGAVALGLWLLVSGRQPGWMQEFSRRLSRWVTGPSASAVGTTPARRLASVGLLWGAWPCGLLQSALVVAALASTPLDGAAVMAAFALGSSLGLVAGPALWRGLSSRSGGWATPQAVTRLAGALLAAASAWALWHLVAGALDPAVCR
ncbi:MAG: sulfite exporter TauE/SafE family protein [Ideonella sp.]|nr:sulfite exporter TauE/SafE family protein [Ideonella sp.]